MSGIKYEIFDYNYDHLDVIVEKDLICLKYFGENIKEYFSFISKISKYCRNKSNNVINYPIRHIIGVYKGNPMTHSIHITGNEIWSYQRAYEYLFSYEGSANLSNLETGVNILNTVNCLGKDKQCVKRKGFLTYLPNEYMTKPDLELYYSRLRKNKSLTDYEVRSHLTIDLDNKDIPREELPFYNIGITANLVELENKLYVLAKYVYA
jgi:hypothetical protein